MRRFLLAVTISLLFLGGCSHGKSDKAVVDALTKRLNHDTVQLFVMVGRVSSQCNWAFSDNPDPTKIAKYQAAEKAGLITIAEDGPGFWKIQLANPDPKFAAVVEKARHDVKGGCNSINVGLLVASKALVNVVDLQPITDEKSEAVYNWKWQLQPDGVRLVNNLSDQERAQLTPYLEGSRGGTLDPSFHLADMMASGKPRQDKKTLKKSGDGWVVDE